MGSLQRNSNQPRSARARRPRARTCFRRGCGRKFTPRRWNQRYCQDAECRKELRRWQAARRQAKRRQDEQAKAQHAAAERTRRQKTKASPQPSENAGFKPARGHAAKDFFPCRSANVPAAMKLRKAPLETRPSIAAERAARPSATSSTANASGSLAALWRDKRNAPSNTAKPERNAAMLVAPRPAKTPLAHRPTNSAPHRAGRHLSPESRVGS